MSIGRRNRNRKNRERKKGGKQHPTSEANQWGKRRKRRDNLVVLYLAFSSRLMSHSHHSQPFSSTSTRSRGRYRWSREGHDGKYIRARGRGHRGGLSTRYQERLAPNGEQLDEADVAELEARYARRTLGTNTDRYEEPEPEIGPDGMSGIEPFIVDII